MYTLKFVGLRGNQLSGAFPFFIFNKSSLQDLDLSDNALSGEIPANICSSLPFLEYFSLSQNMFHGGIPSALSKCTYLQILGLSFNDFSGAIPKEIGNLTKLQELYLGRNRLQGEIPPELGNLAELELMWLSENELQGVTCDVHSHRVTVFNVSGLNLTGTIPSQLGNLSSLQSLNLSFNRLSGSIPSATFITHTLKYVDLRGNQLSGAFPSFIFNKSSLQDLDLSYNALSGEIPANICSNLPFLEYISLSQNMFHGGIPSALSKCTYLQILGLSFNDFSGAIPKEIGNVTKLKELYLVRNRLQGEIPRELSNLAELELMSLFDNELQGEIPLEISNLSNLEQLELGSNKLVGTVPAAIFNVSTLQALGLQNNSLSGSLSSIVDVRLPNLKMLQMWGNNFSGTIPRFIFNASKLSILELSYNSFSGFIPNTIGNLRNLQVLRLSNNYLTSSTLELSFLSSLSNCKSLTLISFSNNPLDGILPKTSVGNLSHSLEYFEMAYCNVSGGIPEEIGNLTNLTIIYLGGNKLNGSIPSTLGKLQKLQGLGLENNKLEGSIPDSICRSDELYELELGGNKLSGSIPECFNNLASLRILLLGSNELTSIPLTFWNLKDILYLNFSSNFLTGPLPLEIGNLKVLVGIDFSMNNFSEKLSYLKDLNLSFNKLEGEIPRGGSFGNFSAESFEGNELLCGSPNLRVPPCKTSIHHISRKNAFLLGIVLPLSTVFMIVVIFLIVKCRKRERGPPNDANMPPEAMQRMFSYLELCRATDGFSENNLIGRGGFGSVFKARLGDGMEVAVKVFNLQYGRVFKSFDVECEMMKSIHHRNIIKVISSCSNEEFKALVLEYMPHGSLEKYLHSSNYILDIYQRLNIMIDVASTLEYLHFGYSAQVIHCDLKPSNVLLDDNMVAHLSDFGIAKLLTREDISTIQTQTLATIGYMAPDEEIIIDDVSYYVNITIHRFWVTPPVGFCSPRLPLPFLAIHSHQESLFCHRSIVGIHGCRARFRCCYRALELTAGTIELSVIGTFRLELPGQR
ncbi:protein kinase domain-containing protein [Citrus sinensis]|nr:protein kinase domain-containing protein [Citrus sinensis]